LSKGVSGQSVNLQEWQSISGSALASVAANGLVNGTVGGVQLSTRQRPE